MHSSYALSSDDFAVERDGAAGSLSELWPGGYQPGDRLGVVLNQPMDPCGCSNLICGTNTLFYDVLRETKGTGGFFRYADTYLIGVGCEPGDFNQLDVWPMHKFVGVLQPTAEAVLETINDRRITLLVLPEGGLRCRGEVVLSTWNALLAQVRCVVTYSPRTGRARGGDVGLLGNKIVESYVEQAIFSTPGIGAGEQARLRRLRRAIDREPLRSYEEYRTLPNAAAARALLGVTEVLPPGHQEVSRRSAPTIIMPLEVPMAPLDAPSAPLDAPGVAAAPADDEDTGSYELPSTGTLLHTPFDAVQRRMGGQFAEWEGWDWISDFGDPIAEHHAVRETVGLWDESPLQKWLFKGPDALAAADYCFTSDMAGARRSARCATARSATSAAGCSATAPSTTPATTSAGILVVTALSTDGDHFRRAIADQRSRRRGRRAHGRDAAPPAAGPEVAGAARVADGRRHRIAALLPLPRGRHDRRRARLPRLAHGLLGRARLRDLHVARERRAPLERAARRRPVARHPPLRPRRGGVAAHRVGPDLPRLRLLPGLHVAVPHEPRSHDQARQARVPRQGRTRGRARGRNHASHGDARDRGRGGTRLQHAGLSPRARGRAAALAQRRAFADRRPHDRHGLHRERADRGRHAARGRARPTAARCRRSSTSTRSTTRRRRGRGPDA